MVQKIRFKNYGKGAEYVLGIRGTLNIFDVFLPIAGGLFISWLGYYASFGIVSLVMFSTFLALKPEKEG